MNRTGYLGTGIMVLLLTTSTKIFAEVNIPTITDKIREQATEYLNLRLSDDHQDYDINVDTLDPRLSLPTCTQNLESFLPPGRKLLGNTTVGVRCNGAASWTVYVSATIKLFGNVVVTRKPINSAMTISDNDLRLEKRDLALVGENPIQNIEDATGLIPIRTLGQGVVLQSNMLSRPALIKRGQKITIIVSGPGILVSTAGEAMNDGRSRETINVRNLLNKKVVTGIVIDSSTVQLSTMD
jgi:flagellar basal body P-ring formation protein FlgA